MAKALELADQALALGEFPVGCVIESGGKVIAIDNHPDLIEKVKNTVTQSILLDSTDEAAMAQIPFTDVSIAVVINH